jgi:hypothetical protein
VKEKMMHPSDEGPWLALGAICEKVIEDKEGVLSLIRVIDRVVVSAQGLTPPEKMPAVDMQGTLVISLKAGAAQGRHAINIEIEGPDGITRPGPQYSMVFEAPDRGHNLMLQLQMRLELEGLYWFNIRLEDRLLTRVPLRAIYAPTKTVGGA